MVGILSYGTYIPRYRLLTEDIANTWKKDAREVVGSLGIREKAVAGGDEDAVTLAIESAGLALRLSPINREDIGALFVGSESHPYAVNPSSTTVGELLGIGTSYLAADMQFACKAGTAGMQAIAGLIDGGHIRIGLAIGSDVAQSRPHDALEYTSASAAASYLLGNADVFPSLATLRGFTSYSSDTPDFWRRDGIRYPAHAGRFTGEPAYFTHVMGGGRELLEKFQTKPKDITWCVFHMPNGKFPRDVAKRLGFTPEQLAPSLTVDAIGNPYAASSMVGFSAVLDQAKSGDTIFMVSYGSGAGSDAFLWEVTEHIIPFQQALREKKRMVRDQIERKTYITYVEYLKMTHKI